MNTAKIEYQWEHKQQSPEVLSYIRHIRNAEKRRYASDYLYSLAGASEIDSSSYACSVMAKQAVRNMIDAMIKR